VLAVNVFKVLGAAREAFKRERDGGRQRLLLPGDGQGNALLLAVVQIVLHAERAHEQRGEHEQQPRAEAVEDAERAHFLNGFATSPVQVERKTASRNLN
jgi:hypothetical protein